MIPFDVGFIKAETHTPEYLMHKYWARKPHNVIRECIRALTNEGDIVIDPFCGSGVALREGAVLGRKCYGFDINPVAVLISKVLLNPPKKDEFINSFDSIYNKAYERYGHLYKTTDGKTIKYLAHKIVAKCECGAIATQEQCLKDGKKHICPHCHNIVRFNLESLADTEILNISIENDKEYIAPESEITRQRILSSYMDDSVNTTQYDFAFPENRRILAFKGIMTSSFFTKRNFCILCYFANKIWEIKDDRIRDCALLLLTGSVAQCSRLIANRNNLSTGGPAWSVPGFWVPQEHIESNPFVHLRARISKFKKALEILEKTPAKTETEIHNGNSLELLSSDAFSELKADLIFLDPPYGDSVPYTEFSAIWNSFLKIMPLFNDDISVTDRIDKAQSWNVYREKLNGYMACFAKHLTEKGKLLITFNNNDMRAWTALIAALQNNGFVCQSVSYQIPAVISSKAQMSLSSSYISDVYSIYTYRPEIKPTSELSALLSHLCLVANSREGKITKTVLDREFIISWLKNNIEHQMLKNKDEIVSSLFEFDKKANIYVLKSEYRKETELLKNIVNDAMHKLLNTGVQSFLDSYLKMNAMFEEFGTMELGEFRSYISDFTIENGKVCGCTQLSLF